MGLSPLVSHLVLWVMVPALAWSIYTLIRGGADVLAGGSLTWLEGDR